MSEAWQMKAPTERLAQAVEDQGGRSIERVLGQRVTFTTHPNPQSRVPAPKHPEVSYFRKPRPFLQGPAPFQHNQPPPIPLRTNTRLTSSQEVVPDTLPSVETTAGWSLFCVLIV